MEGIVFKDVSFAYQEETILHNINTKINDGETVLLCGPSGSGKSTFLQLINGIIPEQKDGKLTGDIFINGRNAKETNTKEKSLFIGSVFQNPKSQFFHLNTTDELFFGAANHLIPLEEMTERLTKISKDFEITNLINRNIFNLSGGEKQRIACASVAMMEPQIYLLDEPSANLDEQSIEKLKSILKVLKSKGATILIAEHRLYYALEICDKVIYMKDGKIEKEYPTQEFLSISEKNRKEMGLRKFTKTSLKNVLLKKELQTENIVIENLIGQYQNKDAVHIEKLTLPKHQIVAIIGENGAGKSTFVKAFSGLLKTKKAKINGQPLKAKEQQKVCFMVMQDVNTQLYSESVLDELISMTDESDEIKEEAIKVLKQLNLSHFKDMHPMVLSGGQKQRVAIATALFLNKKYLIFDEPTSGLDYDNMKRVSSLLTEIKTKVDCVILITHDTELIESCANECVLIKKGEKVNQ